MAQRRVEKLQQGVPPSIIRETHKKEIRPTHIPGGAGDFGGKRLPDRAGPLSANKRLWIPNIAVRIVDQAEIENADPNCVWKLIRQGHRELIAEGLLPRNAQIPKIISRANHFDTKKAKFYRLHEHDYLWQGRRYAGYSFERLPGFDQSLKL